jgi:hypothetical protein
LNGGRWTVVGEGGCGCEGSSTFKPVARIKPTVRHVTEIVPQSVIPKLKPR